MPTIPSAFNSANDAFDGSGRQPMIFDVLAPDGDSILPEDVRLIMHVNPKSLQRDYPSNVTRQATMGGYVEFDWGLSPLSFSVQATTGSFIHLYAGIIAVTGPTPSSETPDSGDTRRVTIAYDKFLDMMAMFQSNAAVYDQYGRVAYQGKIKVTYHGDTFYGWFSSFNFSEAAENPNQMTFDFAFHVDKEVKSIRTVSRARL